MYVLGLAALVITLVLGVATGGVEIARRRRAEREAFESIPHEDLHPVASYLYAMCSVPGQEVSDFAYPGCSWLIEGRLRGMPRAARRLRAADRAGLPLPYGHRSAQPTTA